jgi:hypothetical protein
MRRTTLAQIQLDRARQPSAAVVSLSFTSACVADGLAARRRATASTTTIDSPGRLSPAMLQTDLSRS